MYFLLKRKPSSDLCCLPCGPTSEAPASLQPHDLVRGWLGSLAQVALMRRAFVAELMDAPPKLLLAIEVTSRAKHAGI